MEKKLKENPTEKIYFDFRLQYGYDEDQWINSWRLIDNKKQVEGYFLSDDLVSIVKHIEHKIMGRLNILEWKLKNLQDIAKETP